MERWYLEVRRDEGAERIELVGELLTLGHAPGNTVTFPTDDTVSQLHAAMERMEHGWCIRDVGSANGTYVNGEKLVAQRSLQPGDEITLGGSRITFETDAPDEKTPSAGTADGPVLGEEGYLDLTEEWQVPPAVGNTPPSPNDRDRLSAAARPLTAAPRPPAESAVEQRPTRQRWPGASVARVDRGNGLVHGVARGVAIRDKAVLAFRVDRYDGAGNRIDPVPVELRGYRSGQVSEGEEVEVTGRWSHGTLNAKRLVNLTTGADIKGPTRASKVVGAIFGLFFLGWFTFLAITALH